MNKCPKCNAIRQNNSEFCYKCGNKFDEAEKCSSCGATINGNMKFCPKCGGEISNITPVIVEPTNLVKKSKTPKQKQKKFSLKSVGLIIVVLLIGVFALFVNKNLKVENTSIDLGNNFILPTYSEDLIESEKYGLVPCNQIAIILDDGYDIKIAEEIASDFDGGIIGQIDYINLYLLEFQTTTIEELEELMILVEKKEEVSIATLNPVIDSKSIPSSPCDESDDFTSELYKDTSVAKSYELIGVQRAWDIIRITNVDINEVHIGIADDGINLNSPQLKNINVDGEVFDFETYSFYENLAVDDPKRYIKHPVSTHGTSVTNVIAADSKIDQNGIIGIASVLGDKLRFTSKNIFDKLYDYISTEEVNGDRIFYYNRNMTTKYNGMSEEDEQKHFSKTDDEFEKYLNGRLNDKAKDYLLKKAKFEDDVSYTKTENWTKNEDSTTNKYTKQEYEDEKSDLTSDYNEAFKSEVPTFIDSIVQLNRIIESGASIINCSYGLKIPNEVKVNEIYLKFLNKIIIEHPKVLFVVAAGNKSIELTGENDLWGMNNKNVICVTSINDTGGKSKFTNYSLTPGVVDIAAPGENIPTDFGNNGVFTENGTSFATPMVSSTAALMRAVNPKLSASQIKGIIKSTALSPKGFDTRLGSGIIQIDKAVLEAINIMRDEDNLERLKYEEIIELTKLNFTAEGSGKNYILTVDIKAISKDTVIKIEVNGQCIIDGEKIVTLDKPQKLKWNIEIMEEVRIKVSRSDTDKCELIHLSPIDWVGVWTGGIENEEFGESGIIPMKLEVTIDEEGNYSAQVDMYPLDILGNLELTNIEGFNTSLSINIEWLRDMYYEWLNPTFQEFQFDTGSIRFVVFYIQEEVDAEMIAYTFEGVLAPDGTIIGRYVEGYIDVNGKILFTDNDEAAVVWRMRKGTEGIYLDFENEVFQGFWQHETTQGGE